MEELYISERRIEKIDFSDIKLEVGEYECCTFVGCNFADVDLSNIVFAECEFKECNLSMVSLDGAALREVTFNGCKILGVNFGTCNTFGFAVRFKECILDNSSFYAVKLIRTVFKQTKLREVDFSEADLSSAVFADCDLGGAVFDHTTLERADFSDAYNYSLDPNINRIKRAKFSTRGLAGLLDRYQIDIVAD